MTRPPRGEEEGAIHHAVPQGNGRRRIVEDDRDRRAYMARFQRVGRELGWFESAGCLMDTHHHTVVKTTEPNLGLGMQRVQGGHSRWLNARHGREGQVFRHRFWSKRVFEEAWFFRACIYVVVNPVAAGLCGHPADWQWSSYAATAFGNPDAFEPGEERLLTIFGVAPGEARRRYIEVVDEAAELVRARRIADGHAAWRALANLETHVWLPREQVSG